MENYRIKFGDYVLSVFMGLTMFFPVEFNSIKIVLCLLMIAVSFLRYGTLRIPLEVFIYTTCNALFLLYAKLNGVDLTMNLVVFNLVYPILFSLTFSIIDNKRKFELVGKIIVIMGTVIAVYDSLFALTSLVGIRLPSWLYFEQLDLGFSNYYGYTHFKSRHIGSLLFSIPFTLVLFLGGTKGEWEIFPKRILLFSLVSQYLCAILSTRGALIVISIIAFPIYRIINKKTQKDKTLAISTKKILFYCFIMICLISVLVIFYDYLLLVWNYLANKVTSELDIKSGNIRIIQSRELIKGWLSSPILGSGIGSSVEGLIRDETNIGAYEMTYFASLFQTGLVGFSVLIWYYLFIIKKVLSHCKQNDGSRAYSIAMAVSLICFLLANSVDPYLGKFGFMWVLYIPLTYGCSKIEETDFYEIIDLKD